MKSNEMQISLKKSKIDLILKELDKIQTEKELIIYLESLDLSELLEIYYIQSSEISRIRSLFKKKD